MAVGHFGVVTYLWEVSGNHCPIRKLPASQGLESLGGRLMGVVFDVDLSDAC